MLPRTNILELRQLLAEKFPGVRMAPGRVAPSANRYPTGVPQFDALLGGGLARGGITELVTPGVACGSALFLVTLLRHVCENGQWVALIDAADCFDPAPLENEMLARLLWIRSAAPQDALKAADILLRDGNIPLVVLDLVISPLPQLRRIPSSTWHRLQRIIENTSATLLVMTPEPMAGSTEARLFLDQQFAMPALDQSHDLLLSELAPRLAETSAQREMKIA